MSQERFVSSVEATPLDSVSWSPRPGFSTSETPRFTTSYHVWNYTTSVLSVSDRFGLSFLARPLNSNTVQRLAREKGKQFKPGFYFTIEYRQLIDRRSHRVEETQFDSRCVLNQSNPNPILRGVKESAETFTDRNGDSWEVHYIDFYVPEDVPFNAKDCVYLQNLDLLISTKCSTDMLPHLFSEEGSKIRSDYHPTCTSLPSGGLQIVHIDNSAKHPSYFINLGGVVVDVVPIKDFNLQSGFYLYRCRHDKDSFGRIERADPDVDFYTFEEMMEGKSPLRIWLTYAEAESLGNVDRLKEEEMKERERQWQREKLAMEQEEAKRKQDYAEKEAKWKTEKLDAEAKLADLKIQHAKLEAEFKETQLRLEKLNAELKAELDKRSAERKDYYDERSSSRKDSSEGWLTALKIGAAVLTVGVAAFKLFF